MQQASKIIWWLVAEGTVSVERTGAIELASLSCKTDDKMQIS